jgi:hypothetical protein
MASWLAPGPWMVSFLLRSSSPLVSVMVSPFRLGAKTMVSPLLAAAISARSEPVPLSALLMTVSVLGASDLPALPAAVGSAVVFGYRLSPFEAISDCGLPMSARIKTT